MQLQKHPLASLMQTGDFLSDFVTFQSTVDTATKSSVLVAFLSSPNVRPCCCDTETPSLLPAV